MESQDPVLWNLQRAQEHLTAVQNYLEKVGITRFAVPIRSVGRTKNWSKIIRLQYIGIVEEGGQD